MNVWKDSALSFLRGALLVISALAFAVVMRFCVIEPFIVPTGSMLPTIQLDERILCEKVSYHFKDIEVGDIICFESAYHDGLVLVKRVIALPGQTVDIRAGKVYVDGEESPYGNGVTDTIGTDIIYPVRLGDNELWVMGDNRSESADSRVFGAIPDTCVIGRVFAKAWPLASIE